MSENTLVIGNKNYSSWSLRGWWLLKKAGIPFREIRIPLVTDQTEAQILRYSPAGRVPIFIEGDLTVWDSAAIAEYVAEQKPNLWPADARQRAHARSICAEMHSGFQPLRQALPMNCRARGRRVALNADVQADIDRILQIWDSCLSQAPSTGDGLFGAFTIADAMFAPVVFRFLTYGIPVKGERLQRYLHWVETDIFIQQWQSDARAESETIAAIEVGMG